MVIRAIPPPPPPRKAIFFPPSSVVQAAQAAMARQLTRTGRKGEEQGRMYPQWGQVLKQGADPSQSISVQDPSP